MYDFPATKLTYLADGWYMTVHQSTVSKRWIWSVYDGKYKFSCMSVACGTATEVECVLNFDAVRNRLTASLTTLSGNCLIPGDWQVEFSRNSAELWTWRIKRSGKMVCCCRMSGLVSRRRCKQSFERFAVACGWRKRSIFHRKWGYLYEKFS